MKRHPSEPVVITKPGRVVALVVPPGDDDRPWEHLRGAARWFGDALAPVLDEGAPLVSRDRLIVGSRLAKPWRPAPARPRP